MTRHARSVRVSAYASSFGLCREAFLLSCRSSIKCDPVQVNRRQPIAIPRVVVVRTAVRVHIAEVVRVRRISGTAPPIRSGVASICRNAPVITLCYISLYLTEEARLSDSFLCLSFLPGFPPCCLIASRLQRAVLSVLLCP